MSSILVDSRGNPLVADPIGPMYGPVRFEDQPAYVRRRGRKGKALSHRRSHSTRRSRSTSRRSSRRSSSSARNRRDYRHFLSKRAETYGPVAFADQPTWVRRRGRKGKALSRRRRTATRGTRRSLRRAARRSGGTSRRSIRAMRRSGQITRRQARKLNRQLARQSRSKTSRKSSKRRGRKSSRSMSRRSSRGGKVSRRGAARVLTYASLMSTLRKRRGLKAWVCVGKKRTGCGGGRKGYRGSRQLGVLRP